MTETIVAAAIRIETQNAFKDMGYPDYMIISAPAPARHHHLLHPMATYLGRPTGSHHQGFITSTGRYVGREEGLKIALASGQPMIEHDARNDKLLFSEDLW